MHPLFNKAVNSKDRIGSMVDKWNIDTARWWNDDKIEPMYSEKKNLSHRQLYTNNPSGHTRCSGVKDMWLTAWSLILLYHEIKSRFLCTEGF